MSLRMINFEGAEFFLGGRYSRVWDSGEETNVRHIQVVVLADGVKYQKAWPYWRWEKWIPNKDYRRFPDSHGYWRKVNDRMANLLDAAWRKNFKREPEGV